MSKDMTMPERIVWMQAFLELLSDNASWAVPRTETVYVIDKPNKTFVRDFGEGDPATEDVLAEMGWIVKSKEQ